MKQIIRTSLSALACLALASAAFANDTFALDPYGSDRLVNLRGHWRFSIGDDPSRAQPDFDDGSWTQIYAPKNWEAAGYRGYDGYAWYRKTFTLPKSSLAQQVFIYLGTIDDVDEVYINGEKVGSSGLFPPNYRTAYNERRSYTIPDRLLRAGEDNLVAVRVYDTGGKGGIDSGRLGIYANDLPPLKVDLSGKWKFRIGDDPKWAAPDLDESEFDTLYTPGFWERQGYPNYDGYAWYRKTFTLTPPADRQQMVLLLGKIDDLDEVYLNGVKIGATGKINQPEDRDDNQSYSQFRGYYFSSEMLQATNTISVRVYDFWQDGGIYEGPLGIASQDDYIRFWEQRRKSQSFFKDFQRLFE